MKKNLVVIDMITILLMVFTGCSEDEMVTPNETRVQSSDVVSEKDNDAARKKSGKYIATPVTGTMDGSAFTAEYRITRFIAENDVLYAVGNVGKCFRVWFAVAS